MVNLEKGASQHDRAMAPQHLELYHRIQAFSLDRSDACLPFSQRLARENGWSLEETQHVIEEYKKFTFLAVVTDHPVTPSERVDRVWHLHLSYTRSYWEEFCPQVLQFPLHHEPTCGGEAENQKFDDWYRKTLESYEQFFGQIPPEEIWPKPDAGCDCDFEFVWVNTQQNWVVSKLQVQNFITAGLAIVFAAIVSGCYVISSASTTPFAGIMLAAIFISAGFGLIRFFASLATFFKNPKARMRGGCSVISCGVGCGGCGHHSSDGGGCGGGCGGG
ncbi:MAG: hypothetical protein SVX43_10795 [Cyanobacteriota bacterium]|nr:hypothetical protein [Cyanobacteriota bacterium]